MLSDNVCYVMNFQRDSYSTTLQPINNDNSPTNLLKAISMSCRPFEDFNKLMQEILHAYFKSKSIINTKQYIQTYITENKQVQSYKKESYKDQYKQTQKRIKQQCNTYQNHKNIKYMNSY